MRYKNSAISGLVLMVFFLLVPALQAQHEEEFSKVLPLSSKGTFSLKNVNGNVYISTWKEEKVEIKAVKSTRRDPENLEKVKIEVTASADQVTVETVYPKLKNTGVSVKYEVKVPEGVNLKKVGTVNGNVELTGPFGLVDASTTNGNVRTEDASGTLSLSTTNGSVEAARIKGKLEAETVNGSIKLEIEEWADGLSAETVNGGITLKLANPENINAELSVKTVNGSISVDFPITMQGMIKSKHSLDARLGQGGPLIRLKTVNGSIRLAKL